jgi:uncharacterized protein (TIGR04255 family)
MPYVPINGDHAIQTVSFGVALSRQLTRADMQAVRASHKRWRAELPAVATPQGVELQMDSSGGPPKAVSFPGLEFSFLRPDGTPAWTLRLLGPDVTVDCNRYTRWAKTWDRAYRYLSEALQILERSEAELKVLTLSLMVLDRFRAESSNDSLQSLFKASSFIAANLFEAGPAWHQHTGWFKTAGSDRVLNQVNIDARTEMYDVDDGESRPSLIVSLQHLQQWQITAPISVQSQLTSGIELMRNAMNIMHVENKHLLSQMLDEQMLNRIGFFAAKAEA